MTMPGLLHDVQQKPSVDAPAQPLSVIPAQAGIHLRTRRQRPSWIPACAGMTPRLAVLSLTLCATLALGVVGCKGPGGNVSRLDDGAIMLKGNVPKGRLPSYDELAKKFNERLKATVQFKSQAQIEIVYHDADGKRHYEQADQGRVIMLLPDHMAVLVRKFGVGDLFFAGSNDKQYWLFDLTDKDNRVLYQGSKAVADKQDVQQLPVPVQPRDLPVLMGLATLPVGDTAGSVSAVQGGYLLTPAHGNWRVVVDAKTTLPLRVDLLHMTQQPGSLDMQKRVYMTALLSKGQTIETYGKPPGAWPRVMQRIELRPHDSGDYLVVHLSAIQNDGEVSKEDRAFDLSRLIKTYKPDKIVDMDKQ